ncbi:MAG: ArnT family glycosyltransferase [Phycisphaerae bacterium]
MPKRRARPLERSSYADPRWVDLVCLALAAAVLVVFRIHAFDLPLETDECNYAYIAARLLEGERLYLDVWDHQPFGIFALFAGVIALFGDSPEVFRWLATAFSLSSLVLIHEIVRVSAGRCAAVTAVLLFAVASSDPGTAGEGCNREIYMNTLILFAWYIAMRPTLKPGSCALASGCALGVASSIKTIVAVHWVLLAAWIGFRALRRAPVDARWRSTLAALATFVAGPAAVWVAVFAYFALTQRLAQFTDAVFMFNLSYSGEMHGVFDRFVGFFTPQSHPFIFESARPLWVGGAAGAVWLIIESLRHRSSKAVAIVLLVIAGYAATCLPGKFWPHYYYLLVPAMVVSLSAAMGSLARVLGGGLSSAGPRLRRAAIVLLYVAPSISLCWSEYSHYLSQAPFGITVTRYNSRDFWGRAQGENVRRVTEPGDTIFVFGNEAEIYYYSQRRCASRYTMITGIQSGYAEARRRRATLLAELEQDPPRLILVLFDEDPFPEWKDYLERHYSEPIGWDLHDRTGKPIMFVVSRKDKPVESIDWNWDRRRVGGWLLGDRR